MDVSCPDDYKVEYDFSKGARCQFLIGVLWSFSLFGMPIIGINFNMKFEIPTLYYIFAGIGLFFGLLVSAAKYYNAYHQKCVITSTDILITMVANKNKIIPLESVLEVNIVKGCVESMFGICKINIETTVQKTMRVGKSVIPIPEGVLIAPLNAEFIRNLILKRREELRRVVGGIVRGVQIPRGITTAPIPMITGAPMQTTSVYTYPSGPYGYNNNTGTMITPMVAPMQPLEQQQPLPYNSVPLQQYTTTPYAAALPGQQTLPYNTNPYTAAPPGHQHNTNSSLEQQQPLPNVQPSEPENTQQEIERVRAQIARLEENHGKPYQYSNKIY
jgi:hypothetical protein